MQKDATKNRDSEDAAEGQLNAGRILDRSRSSNDSRQDFSEHLFGSSRGASSPHVAPLGILGKKQTSMGRIIASRCPALKASALLASLTDISYLETFP